MPKNSDSIYLKSEVLQMLLNLTDFDRSLPLLEAHNRVKKIEKEPSDSQLPTTPLLLANPPYSKVGSGPAPLS